MTIGLITARGGSTRTPRKNMAMVCGLPLVAWSVIQSRCSHLVDDTYLTTDDDEIAEAGGRAGAKIIRRPVLDNGITAGVVFLDAVRKMSRAGVTPDTLLTILPTSPLRKPDEFDRMIRAHMATGEMVTTACPQKETFAFRNLVPWQDRFHTRADEGWYRAHQHIGDKFWNYSKMAGGAGVASRSWYMDEWQGNPERDFDIDTKPVDRLKSWVFVPVEEWQTFDIDYPSDLELVTLLMEHYIVKGKGADVYLKYKADVKEMDYGEV
jgi:hypothetical protein